MKTPPARRFAVSGGRLFALTVLCYLLPLPSWADTVELSVEVDAREIGRKLLHTRMELPVETGELILLYPKWIPGIHGPRGPVENLGGPETGVGAKRRCRLVDGRAMLERVVEWNDGTSYTVEFLEMPLPVDEARTTLEVQQDDSARSIATMTFSYKLRPGFLNKLVESTLLRPVLRKRFRKILAGLARKAETGKDSPPGDTLHAA